MKNGTEKQKIKRNVLLQFGIFFAFFLFNSVVVGERGFFIAASVLLGSYLWNFLDKILLRT